MFTRFFEALRDARVPVSLREFLTFLQAMRAGLVTYDVEGFYWLARAAMVKDERHIDRFDLAFARTFEGLEAIPVEAVVAALDLPPDWLARMAERHLTEAEKAEIAALGGFDKLMQTLRQRLAEQQGRHQGGSKWIGTAGTSPFGAFGYNPEGCASARTQSRHRRAVKVWDRREFRDLDDSRELGTRNIKVALKRLRQWAREGVPDELDLDGTIRATAEHGYLDVQTRPERRNAVRVLLLLDVGGSMDPHVRMVEELFSAARSRVPPPPALLLPQLRLRGALARQPPPPDRDDADLGRPPHLRPRVEADPRRRRRHEPLRARRPRRRRRALERRGRRDLAPPPRRAMARPPLDQPHAPTPLAAHAVDRPRQHPPRPRPHGPPDAGGFDPRHAHPDLNPAQRGRARPATGRPRGHGRAVTASGRAA